MKWLTGAAAASLMLMACGTAASNVTGRGAVTGLVTIRACGGPPPRTPQPTCTERPLNAVEVDLTGSQGLAGKTVTDQAGHYTIWVPPGTYTARVVMEPGQSESGGSRSVTVVSGKTVEADFHIIFEAL